MECINIQVGFVYFLFSPAARLSAPFEPISFRCSDFPCPPSLALSHNDPFRMGRRTIRVKVSRNRPKVTRATGEAAEFQKRRRNAIAKGDKLAQRRADHLGNAAGRTPA